MDTKSSYGCGKEPTMRHCGIDVHLKTSERMTITRVRYAPSSGVFCSSGPSREPLEDFRLAVNQNPGPQLQVPQRVADSKLSVKISLRVGAGLR